MAMKLLFLAVSLIVCRTAATCFDPSPAFAVPAWTNGAKDLAKAFDRIEDRLSTVVADEKYDAESFSVQVTSNTASLWSQFHSARKRNPFRPGVAIVDGDSLYRIASITKTFTVLGLLYQHEAGNLSLDAPIANYLSELTNAPGGIPFEEITLRALASQLSGLPREFAQGDLLDVLPDPVAIGLPPADKKGLPVCDEYSGHHPACNATDLLNYLKTAKPLFAPNQQSTYSNVAFELIGLAVGCAAGMSYEEYMASSIFAPLNMSLTTLTTPENDDHAVLPIGHNYWDVDEGVQNPTGGIYSSANDMSKYVRYILTHYNAIATGVNWLMPASWAYGMHSFYGMPFEIFRTDKILKDSRRPVTFATKSGGVPGYLSRMSLLPEYGLGVTVLVAFDKAGDLLDKIQEIVTVELVRAAEEVVWRDVDATYSGFYTAVVPGLNSSLELAASSESGLVVNEFISNSTDVVNNVAVQYNLVDGSRPWRLQLVPTMLFKNVSSQQGEIWRIIPAYERGEGVDRGIWDDFCITDVDLPMYAGVSVTEVVFWHEAGIVELPAWGLKMKKSSELQSERETLIVQK